MPELARTRLKSKNGQERLARLDETIATIAAAKRHPNHNADLLKALRQARERERIAALASGEREEDQSSPAIRQNTGLRKRRGPHRQGGRASPIRNNPDLLGKSDYLQTQSVA